MFPRLAGEAWKIPKFHEQLHIAFYIWLYGSHLNIHTGPQEHNHILNAKKPSQHTQKRKRNFENQLGNRLNDRYSIEYTHNNILLQQNKINPTSAVNNANEKLGKSTTKMATKFMVTMQNIVLLVKLIYHINGNPHQINRNI